MRRLLVLALFVGLGILLYQHYFKSPPPGILAPNAPVQRDMEASRTLHRNGYTITRLADFEIEARVIHRKSYVDEQDGELAPVDLALGWGDMSDTRVLDQLSISQNSRFYFYRWPNEPPIPEQAIIAQSANMHMIPANDAIETALLKIKQDQLVRIAGYLVKAQTRDGRTLVSSLTRDDTGAGSCEIIWVESVEVLPLPKS